MEQHVAKFRVGNTLIDTLQPRLNRLALDHAVDGKMLADVTQEIDDIQPFSPIQIIDDIGRRTIRCLEVQKPLDLCAKRIYPLPDRI